MSETKELVSSSSKADISYKPNIYALKEGVPKKNKRPVSAYVSSNGNRRNYNVRHRYFNK